MADADKLVHELNAICKKVRSEWHDLDEMALSDRERRAVRIEIRRTGKALVDLLKRLSEPDAKGTERRAPSR